ncbi:hypothetical protein ACTXT7_004041 [Hymenolepis weldensis]
MPAIKAVLFSLLSLNAILAEELTDAPYVRAIYELVKVSNNPTFDKYPPGIFQPLNGPFYQHLSLSSDPRSRHLAEYGFSEQKMYDEEIALYPPIKKGQVIVINKWIDEVPNDLVRNVGLSKNKAVNRLNPVILTRYQDFGKYVELSATIRTTVILIIIWTRFEYYQRFFPKANNWDDSSQNKEISTRDESFIPQHAKLMTYLGEWQLLGFLQKQTWPMENDIDMVDFMEALLRIYVEDNENELVFDDEEISLEPSEKVTSLNTSRRIELAEFQRPRIFLAFFVDVYRVLLDIAKSCKNNGQFKTDPDQCTDFFTSYDHVLATYTELVCKFLTAFGHYDVDHICPNLCLPRGEPLWHPTEAHKKSIDVCGQIPFAMPATCRLYGKGVYDHEFVCECITSAYRWNTGPGQMILNQFPRCEPKDTQFEKLASGASENFKCSKSEFEYFCSTDGSKE